MAENDVFDLLGISFDPPEKNAGEISDKLKKKLKELGGSLTRETQELKRQTIKDQISFLNEIKGIILSDDQKSVCMPELKKLADQKIIKCITELRAMVSLLSLSKNQNSITSTAIKHYAKETHLSIANVKKVFTEAGFTIIDKKISNSFPVFPTNAEMIYSELAALRSMTNPNPDGVDTKIATDLYGFAAFLSNDTDISKYAAMQTADLFTLFDTAAKRYSQANADGIGLEKLCGDIATKAKMHVFSSDDKRKAYSLYLLYHTPRLEELFAAIKKAPKSLLINPSYADPCIDIITEYFTDYDTALAIYNHEAGFMDEEYVPIIWSFTIKCNYCGSINKFNSEADAKRSNSCTNCKKALFKKCPKCHELIPETSDSCPHCKYIFASAALFELYYQQAKTALQKADFDLAKATLFKAQSVAPLEKELLHNLECEITKCEKKYKLPINTIKSLIAQKKYLEAREKLSFFLIEYPELNLSDYESEINTILNKADSLFKTTLRMTSSQKADVCMSILLICSDHIQSLSYLKNMPPQPCQNLKLSPIAKQGVMQISWSHPSEVGVRYWLVRKEGNQAPVSANDGHLLAKAISEMSYQDVNLRPGLLYTYGVFSERMNVFSSVLSQTGTVLAEAMELHVSQNASGVQLTWEAPSNTRGATVFRMDNGRETKLTSEAFGGYIDPNTQYQKSYTYRVCMNYPDGMISKGIEYTVIRVNKVEDFSIHAVHLSANVYKISWDIFQKGINLRIQCNNETICNTTSDKDGIEVTLPMDKRNIIIVTAYSGGSWVPSKNKIHLDTYSPCKADKLSSEISETTCTTLQGIKYNVIIKIRLTSPIPSYVSGFYYVVRTEMATERWATKKEIGVSEDVKKISIGAYNQQNAIIYNELVTRERAFYISVFTICKIDNKELITESSRMKISRPMDANLFWELTYKRFSGLRLSIELSGNHPIDYVPKLLLCSCNENEFLTSSTDKKSITIAEIPSIELKEPENVYSHTYSLDLNNSIRELRHMKFFLFVQEFDGDDKIAVRWKRGFSGKIR